MHICALIVSLLAGQAAAGLLRRYVVTITEIHTNTVIVPYTGKPAAPRPAVPTPEPARRLHKNPAGAIMGALRGIPTSKPAAATRRPATSGINMGRLFPFLGLVKPKPSVKPVPTQKLPSIIKITAQLPQPTPPPPPPAAPAPPHPPPQSKKTWHNDIPGFDVYEDRRRHLKTPIEAECSATSITSSAPARTNGPETTKLRMYGDHPQPVLDPITTTLRVYGAPRANQSSIATMVTPSRGIFLNMTQPIVTKPTTSPPVYTSRTAGTLPVITESESSSTVEEQTSTIRKTVTVPRISIISPTAAKSTTSSIPATTSTTSRFTDPWDALKPSYSDMARTTEGDAPEKSETPECIFPLPGAPGC
ncbi:hypothetical protein CAC42_3053 [Sphaceloma murrayae]|uniref:Uncharacterized protein n=1 Tax=Sphaceloma murrayae TaxID=2082308 RepID=A0A2K1QRE1_9PEZI|nr:hypothetical protein CAC42_3053 [Sphaceloma murrayae]